MEIPPEKVFLAQKLMFAKCNLLESRWSLPRRCSSPVQDCQATLCRSR